MNGAAVRPRWPASVGVAVVLAALAFALALGGLTWRADRLVYDIGLSFWRRPVPEGIVIVAIDDASVAAIGRWPWPRAVHSTLLARLAAARPRAIGLDVTFSEPDADPAQDALLARQLAAAAPVVMSVDWVIAGPGQTPQLLAPVTGLPPGVSLGTAEASVDADGVMRHAFLGAGPAAAPLPHMALALLRAGGETPAPGLPVAVQDEQVPVAGRAPWLRQQRFLVRYAGPPGHIERVSYLDVLRGAVPPERLAGRYVLVGMTATGLGDTVATPVNRQHHAMPGVEVLAHTLHTLRSGDTVRPLAPLEGATLSAALVLALLAGIERLGAGRGALVLAVGSVPLVVGISLAALGAGVWWSPVPWGLAAVLAYPLWSWRRLQQAVDALDAEIGLLGPEAGLSPGAPVPLPSRRRDALALRLDALHAATDMVRSARRFLSDALAGLPTAMAVTDERGRVLLANALAAQLFELDRAEDMPGLELPGLLVEFMPVPGAPVKELEAIFQPGPTAPAACVVEARAERLGDFLLHFAPVLLLGQQRWVVTFSDVSAIRQAQRRRDRALAFVSHDLRSPANALMLMADLYRRGRMDMTQEAFLDEVQRLGARTQQLADDFVRVAHVETRPLQCQPVALAALLDEVVADFRPQALAAQIRLGWQTDPTAGRSASVWPMDRALVQRAVGNLVSNALGAWWSQIAEWRKRDCLSYKLSDELIKPQHVVETLWNLTRGTDSYVTSDVGQHQMWAAQFYRFDEPRRWINSGGLGTMGVGLPYAMGIKLAKPDADVFCITGEGSIQMNIQELSTCQQYRTPVKVIALNNRYLGMVRQWQELIYEGRYAHSYMDALPDFVKLAESYGHVGIKIERPSEVEPALKEIIRLKDRTVFLDVRTDPTENVWPMVQAGKGITEMLLGSEDL